MTFDNCPPLKKALWKWRLPKSPTVMEREEVMLSNWDIKKVRTRDVDSLLLVHNCSGVCQYKKKSYFYLSLFTVSYNIITIHRRNICDNKFFCFIVHIFLGFSASSSAPSKVFCLISSPKSGQITRREKMRASKKKLSRFQLACRLPLESLKIFFSAFSQISHAIFFVTEVEKKGCNLFKFSWKMGEQCAR